MNLVMFENNRSRMMSNMGDVTVTVTKGHRDDLRRATVYLRGGCQKRIAPNCEYITFGIDEAMGRLYVLPSQRQGGFKLHAASYKSSESVDASLTIYPQHIDAWLSFVGDFDLLYDKEARMCYIDRMLKK